MDPNEIRFTQASIRDRFSDGQTIGELADALIAGKILPEEIPPLRLFLREGVYFSLDNRRLEAFRRAKVPIPYRIATQEEVAEESWKFTTKNKGVSVRIRGEVQ